MRQQMPKQPSAERIKNFAEVALGFSPEQAVREASRCLQCPKPFCVQGCPVEVDIPKFVAELAAGHLARGLAVIKKQNKLPAICGRVCPQESQCEANCVLGRKGQPIAIGGLERFLADWGRQNREASEENTEESIHRHAEEFPEKLEELKVAVIGSGPAGLTAAADLAQAGLGVTVFEALHAPGGVLRYGIPEFRLPKSIVDQEVEAVRQLGVEFRFDYLIGRTLSIEDLFAEGFRAVFVGTGAGLPYFLNIPGENLNGVYSANEFLTRVNLMKAYRFPAADTPVKIGRRTAVVGAGNVAMDAARTAVRLGAEKVYLLYRRSRQEMPARLEEIENAEEEGVQFHLLTNPLRIVGDSAGNVCQVVCQEMTLGEPDASGRRRPLPVADSEFALDVDSVIVAVGQGPNPILRRGTPDLEVDEHGLIKLRPESFMTSIPGVFAAGDIVTGAATVIAAMGDGRRAAREIMQYLKVNNAVFRN